MASPAEDADQAYASAIGALSQVLVDAPSMRQTLEQLLAVAVVAAPRVSALTVTALTEDGSLTAAASTDQSAQNVDELEYALDEGPCVEALSTGEEQLVRDTGTDPRWPRFAAKAREEGFGSIAGLPLRASDGEIIGALNVFSDRPDGLPEDDLALLRRVCGPAAAVLANARAYRRTSLLSQQLTDLLDRRAILNRAIGVVLGRRGGDVSEAERLLEAIAAREGRSVADVAARLVAGEDIALTGPADGTRPAG